MKRKKVNIFFFWSNTCFINFIGTCILFSFDWNFVSAVLSNKQLSYASLIDESYKRKKYGFLVSELSKCNVLALCKTFVMKNFLLATEHPIFNVQNHHFMYVIFSELDEWVIKFSWTFYIINKTDCMTIQF